MIADEGTDERNAEQISFCERSLESFNLQRVQRKEKSLWLYLLCFFFFVFFFKSNYIILITTDGYCMLLEIDNHENNDQISSVSCQENGKRPADEQNDTAGNDCEADRRRYKRFKIVSREEQFQWTLPKGMATYVNDLFEKYIPEKELKESILLKNPVPDNVHAFRRMDDFLELIDRKKFELESLLERIHKRNLEVMGPMTRLRSIFDKVTDNQQQGGEEDEIPSPKECLQLMEQAMLLAGQTGNMLTYERRKNALSSLYSTPS